MRCSAVEALGALGELAPPHVAALFKDKDWEARCSAVKALGGLGKLAAPHIPSIAALLEDEKSSVR